MKTFKYTSLENTVVHVIDDDGVSRSSMLASSLPDGVDIEAADAPPPTVAEKLAQLDFDNQLTQRNLRDFIRVTTEALKLGQPVDLTVLPGVAKVYEVEAQAATLRSQL